MKKKLIIVLGIIFILQPVFLLGQIKPPANAFGSMDNAFARMEKTTYDPDEEYFLGRSVAANILAIYKPFIGNPALNRYLNLICKSLALNSTQPSIFNGYYVMMLDTQEINAFATPGGHIFITRGLVQAAATEDALAAIIAHELSHIILKHGINMIEEMRMVLELDAFGQQVTAAAGHSNKQLLDLRNSVADFSNKLIKTGYSKPQEFEADNSAIALLAATGYNPDALLDILRILQRQQNQSSGMFSTHPSPSERISNAQTAISRYRVNDNSSFRISRFINK